MFSLPSNVRKKNMKHWLNYRRYSRQIINQPMNMDLHTSRVMTAMELDEREPLQGALADMFFGCWYDVPYFGERMLTQVKEKLNAQIVQGFEACIYQKKYILESSDLATRWSVLISPSLAVVENQIFVSPDDSRAVANITITALTDLMEELEDEPEDVWAEISKIEDAFFNHCLTTDDRLAFSIVWWELSKAKWQFSSEWTQVRKAFEQKIWRKTDSDEDSSLEMQNGN